jgi:hypothetical protein
VLRQSAVQVAEEAGTLPGPVELDAIADTKDPQSGDGLAAAIRPTVKGAGTPRFGFPVAGAGRLLVRLTGVVGAMRQQMLHAFQHVSTAQAEVAVVESRALEAREHFHNRMTELQEELNLHTGRYRACLIGTLSPRSPNVRYGEQEQAAWAIRRQQEAESEAALHRERNITLEKQMLTLTAKLRAAERENVRRPGKARSPLIQHSL